MDRNDQPRVNDEDKAKIKKTSARILYRTLVGVATYPLTYAKTLFQLGYEPYPLSIGKTFVVAGRDTYYSPNAITYIRNIYRERGLYTLYSGVGSAMASTVIGGFTAFGVNMYMDKYYPDVGGVPVDEDKEEWEMTAHESARFHLRNAIRDTIAHSLAIICSRPFTVIMIRQIAQHVGSEDKYSGFLSSILCIGNEEGVRGYFSGLIPALIADFVVVWGCAVVRYAVLRCLKDALAEKHGEEAKEEDEEGAKKTAEGVGFILEYAVPFVVSSFSYPFNVVSTVMAVTGSGLAISLLPFAPNFTHWNDAYSYMKPVGLTRGNRMFFREHKGAISIGKNGAMYASNKHFV